eukprot:g45912.t1
MLSSQQCPCPMNQLHGLAYADFIIAIKSGDDPCFNEEHRGTCQEQNQAYPKLRCQPKLLKTCAPELATPLAKLFQYSNHTGIYTTMWKIAQVRTGMFTDDSTMFSIFQESLETEAAHNHVAQDLDHIM